MATEIRESNKSSQKFRIMKYTSYSLLIGGLAWLVAMITFSNFIEVSPALYAKTFIAWRNKGGDAAMFSERYKGYKKTDYPTSEEFEKFLDMAQGKDQAYLLTGNYPLHAPRGPENLYTLSDDVAIELWKVEAELKAKLNNKNFVEWREKAIKALKDKKYDKEFSSKWFLKDADVIIDSEDLLKIFEVSEIIKEAAKSFFTIVKKLSDNKMSDYKYIKGNVSDSLYKDIENFLNDLGYKNISKDIVNKFFYNMASVKASPKETFFYSRLFNLWTFLTINHDFDYKMKIEKDDEKKKNEIRSKEKAAIFAQLFARIYENDYKYELKNLTIKDRLLKIFGTSQDVSSVVDQSDNIAKTTTTIEENISKF
ncbi:hypothetical protein NAPIS_ORF02752 [Vairimorpha apis BRL 01]|uniref:Uncharacterized protein n=1 Tax=Vairimorpha apis BRL 01 TaxID=1037528 RepID=T0L4J3_9MICR|nr:hypothetical protein NAPIS_ORF02752 [Vairimorpha apis BRL 01]